MKFQKCLNRADWFVVSFSLNRRYLKTGQNTRGDHLKDRCFFQGCRLHSPDILSDIMKAKDEKNEEISCYKRACVGAERDVERGCCGRRRSVSHGEEPYNDREAFALRYGFRNVDDKALDCTLENAKRVSDSISPLLSVTIRPAKFFLIDSCCSLIRDSTD